MRKIAVLVMCAMILCDLMPALAESVKQVQKKAQAGDAQAQYELAVMYYEGKGIKKNHAEAFKCWLSAAKKGHVDSQRIVGDMYVSGDGVSQNKKEAFRWFLMAAENGDSYSQLVVALAYDNGDADYGVKQDKAEAQKWFQRSSSSKDGPSGIKQAAQNSMASQRNTTLAAEFLKTKPKPKKFTGSLQKKATRKGSSC